MINFGTVLVPQWISSTFTWANFQSALGALGNLGSQFATALWAILSDPGETAKQINTFVTNMLGALSAWIVSSAPKSAAVVSKAFSNAVEWFGGLIDAAITVAKTIPSVIAAWISQAGSAISTAFDDAVSWFKGLLDAAIEVAKTIPGIIGNWITQKATDAVSAALDLGNQIGAKIKEGVLAGLNAETNWLLSWFKIQSAEGGGPTTTPGPTTTHRPLTPADLSGLTPKPGTGSTLPTTTTQISLGTDVAKTAINTVSKWITDLTAILPQINLQTTVAKAAVTTVSKFITDLTAVLPQINLQDSQARKVITSVSNMITDLTAVEPDINLQTKTANKAIHNVSNMITDLTSIEPDINLQTKTANKAIHKVSNWITDLTAIEPQINLQTKDAMKAISAVESKIKGLSSISANVNVHVGVTGPGVKFLATGIHGVVNKPTLFMAGEAGSERIDVSPVGGKGAGLTYDKQVDIRPIGAFRKGGNGSGGGDIIIENHNHVMDQEIVRRVTAHQGKNRYRFGGG
jgi:methyl-accepting chemotaxis protein